LWVYTGQWPRLVSASWETIELGWSFPIIGILQEKKCPMQQIAQLRGLLLLPRGLLTLEDSVTGSCPVMEMAKFQKACGEVSHEEKAKISW
jgi:hypothetical protein